MATRRVTRLQNLSHDLRGMMTVQAVLWFDAPSKPIPIRSRSVQDASLIVGTAHPLGDGEKQTILDGDVIERQVLVPLPDDTSDADVQALLDKIWTRVSAALTAQVKEGGSYGAYSDTKGAWTA